MVWWWLVLVVSPFFGLHQGFVCLSVSPSDFLLRTCYFFLLCCCLLSRVCPGLTLARPGSRNRRANFREAPVHPSTTRQFAPIHAPLSEPCVEQSLLLRLCWAVMAG